MENIGRYNVIAELGRGSSGKVFKAHDRHLDRLVAIKVLTPCQSYEGKPQRTVEMFFREGRATARLMHAGIVEIYDVFEDPEAGRPSYRCVFSFLIISVTLLKHDPRAGPPIS